MRKLLIVDEEAGVRALIRMTLDGGDFEIIEAADGAAALAAVARHEPDLVLLEVVLPDLSGIEVCRRIKGDPLTARMAVIMLTAKARSSDVTQAETAGADGYFTKPFSPIALIRTVESILGGVR